MQLDRFLKDIAPLAALTLAGMAKGCGDRGGFKTNVTAGLPLSELDLTAAAPHTIKLAGPDLVIVKSGDSFSISVEGDQAAKDAVRFLLEDDTLSILRNGKDWTATSPATINLVLPTLEKLVLAGSGTIRASKLAKKASITIAGSGLIETTDIAVKRLNVSIAGSGTYRARGSARKLRVTLAGSGDADMAELKASDAKVSIIGSGDSIFASDGDVDARIMGSGNVTVRGGARCKVKSVGSGTLICERGETGESG